MKAMFVDLLVVAIICVQKQISMVAAVGLTVDTVTITTDSGNPGDGVSRLTMTLYWGDFQYVCANTPGSGTYEYSCDSNDQSPNGSQDPDNPYYLKLKYSTETAALQINTITITDSDGDWYAFDDFCIPPGMTHTMNAVLGSTTRDVCVNGWQSKVSYDDLAMAGDTKFILLYVDFKIFGDRFANTVNEAGVRPPNLVETGYTVLGAESEEDVDIMIQWDTTLYTTRLSSTNTGQYVFTYFLSMVTCGGVESAFTVAYYAEHDGITSAFAFESIFFRDETARSYTLNTWCLENPATAGYEDYTGTAPYNYTADGHDCTAFADHIPVNGIKIADGFDATNPDLAPVLVPSTIFEFPDRTDHGVETEVLAGYFVTTSFLDVTLPDVSEFCWERPAVLPCVAPYGIPGASGAVCPETAQPTSDPTEEPTSAPTATPTAAPTNAPTRAPTGSPSETPSSSPSSSPVETLVFEECVSNFALFDGAGSISMEIEETMRKLRVTLTASNGAWFGVGFGSHMMQDTYAVVVHEQADTIQVSQYTLSTGGQNNAEIIDNALYETESADIGNSRVGSLILDWEPASGGAANSAVYNFTAFLSGELCSLPIIWAKGVTATFGYHGIYKNNELSLPSCRCDATSTNNTRTLQPTLAPVISTSLTAATTDIAPPNTYASTEGCEDDCQSADDCDGEERCLLDQQSGCDVCHVLDVPTTTTTMTTTEGDDSGEGGPTTNGAFSYTVKFVSALGLSMLILF